MKYTGLCLVLAAITLVPAVASGPGGLAVERGAAAPPPTLRELK